VARRTKIRMVATDLDGTLLTPEGVVSGRTAEAVKAARRAGIHVVPATGRPPKSVWDLASAAGLGPLGVCSNGAALVDLDTKTVVAVDEIPGRDICDVVSVLRELDPSVRFAVDDLECFTHEPDFFETMLDWDEQIEIVTDITSALDPGVIQLIARRPGWSAISFMARLDPLIGDRLTVTTSGLDWIYFGLPLVSKASRLATICERLGVDADEVLAVGDHYNDLSMLAWAGTAMAVANAVPEVLAVVDRTLASNAEHGVAALLEELVEIQA
jgi:Cof subfamily protein (haloacid dehalogenase superfamily)